jgi:hypothetical protein
MVGGLRWMVSLCRRVHIAASSLGTYKGLQSIFMQCCKAFGLDPMTINQEELSWVVCHYALDHTTNSVASYLSAIQNLYYSAGTGAIPRGADFLLFLRGLKRLFSPADEVVRTRALGMGELEQILASLDTTDVNDVSFGAQLVVAFMLALRTEDHTDGRLRWGDVYAQPDGSVEFLLVPGKSVRRFRRVAIAPKVGLLSAVGWLARLAEFLPASAKRNNSPVFVRMTVVDGRRHYSPLSRSKFIARFKKAVHDVLGCSPALYAGYSLRRGGVTEMLSSNVPMPVIKRHVGWAPTSDAPMTYYDHHGHLQMRIPTAAMGRRG